MGRITAQAKVTNPLAPGKFIDSAMLVDTGAGPLVLPSSWKKRLGGFRHSEPVELLLANGDVVRGEVCSPVWVEIAGFRRVGTEAVFVDMAKEDEQPLLGYVVLEQAQAAVDMLGHRLVPVKYMDLK